MSKMRFSGLPAGAADVTLRQSGRASSINATIPAEPLSAEKNCFYLQHVPRALNWQGMSVTTKDVEGSAMGGGMYPPVFRESVQVTTGHAHRVISDRMSDATYTHEVYAGGTADVYRVRNGAIEEVRQSRITGGNLGRWHEQAMVTTPGFHFGFARWNAFGERFWFAVAAVDATNHIGTRAEVSYDLPKDAARASAVSNDNVASFSWQEGGGLPAPTGFSVTPAADGEDFVHLTWDPVGGAVGYVIFIAYADPASFVDAPYLQLEEDGGGPLIDGDMVILTNRIMAPQVTMKSRRVYGDSASNRPLLVTPIENGLNVPDQPVTSAFGDWTAEDPAPDAALGTSYARITVSAGAGSARILRQYWSGSAQQTFYAVPRTDQMFRWSAWIEVDRTTTFQLRFGLAGVPEEMFSLTPGWHHVVFERSAAQFRETGTSIDFWALTVVDRGSPVQVRVAGLRYHDVSNAFHHFPKKLEDLVTPGMFLRDHSLIKPGLQTTDIAALTNPPGESSRQTTVEGFLRACKAAGGQPWLQIEWYHTVEDWLDLLAYLAAPVSSGHPMALKRQSNGRTIPWIDAFDGIRLEFGNESWNGLSEFWKPPLSMPDEVSGASFGRGYIFGFLCRRAVEAMQASPYWSDKIRIVLGGWARQNYSVEIADGYRLPVEVGIANYNGGWDEGNVIVSENQLSYQNAVAVVPAATSYSVDHLISGLETLAATPGFPLDFGETLVPTCYEAGPGYQLNGLNGASVSAEEVIVQEVVMKSRAVATGTLETMMYQAESGFALFNFFTLTAGDDWAARASAAQGGGVYPSYELCRVVMEQMGPSSVYSFNGLRTETMSMLTPWADPITPTRGFAYGLRSHADPHRFMFVIGNRNLDAPLQMSLFSTLRSCDAMTAWANIGHYAEHNRYPVGQRLRADGGYDADPNCTEITFEPIRLPVPADPARIDIDASLGLTGLENGMPPGGALLLRLDGAVFEGD